MADKITAPGIRLMREKGQKIVCVTAYDAILGALADESGADLVLVGDSVGNTALGYPSTIPVTLEEMVHHTKAVRRGVSRALLVADLPFGSYQASVAQAVESSVALMKAGAEAVKLEGDYAEAIVAITKAGIPVMGHLGMTPQSLHRFGGFRIQGKGESGQEVIDAAKSIDEAGVFSTVLELIPWELSKQITDLVSNATIGIGAGPECNGQIQVIYDILGFSPQPFKHTKVFVKGHDCLLDGLRSYAEGVRGAQFPSEENKF